MATRRAKATSQPGQKTRAGYVPAELPAPDVPDYVVVELRYEAPVAFTKTRFAAPAAAAPQADSLNSMLARFDITAMRSQFGLPASTVRDRVEVAATLPPSRTPRNSPRRAWTRSSSRAASCRSCRSRAAMPRRSPSALNSQKSVWKAYVAPRPVPAMPAGSAAGSRNFEPAQGYLYDAPNGIGADGSVESRRSQRQRRHDLRHRRQLESQA